MAIQITVTDLKTKAELTDAYIKIHSGTVHIVDSSKVVILLGAYSSLAHRNAAESEPLFTIPIVTTAINLDLFNLVDESGVKAAVKKKIYVYLKSLPAYSAGQDV